MWTVDWPKEKHDIKIDKHDIKLDKQEPDLNNFDVSINLDEQFDESLRKDFRTKFWDMFENNNKNEISDESIEMLSLYFSSLKGAPDEDIKMQYAIESYHKNWDSEAFRDDFVQYISQGSVASPNKNDDIFSRITKASTNKNDYDETLLDNPNITEEDKKNIGYLVNEKWCDFNWAKDFVIQYNDTKQKLKNRQNLTPEEREIYRKWRLLFGKDGRWWFIGRLRRLKELKDLKIENEVLNQSPAPNTSKEYATGNIKDIEPAAIVENNENINNYVYNNRNDGELPDFDHISISREDKSRLFKKLIKQKKGDRAFKRSIRYINSDLSINYKRMRREHIDESSVKTNLEKIIKMVNELAKQEKIEEFNKEKTKNVNARKSTMICCFRAISKFFDTPNNNWENFAGEFEINDLNNDITFDEESWTISMEWTIWANKNHIKLYYNTKTWTLEFDNFLAKKGNDGEELYKIWKWNWERERIKINLPTMNEMEDAAKSINFGVINWLSGKNIKTYDRMVWFAMTEAVRFKCFHWILWSDIDTNKSFIKRFNEKNILKQDIIKNIYKMFYSEKDINNILNSKTEFLSISKSKEPEQFKLVKLISDSIDHYDNANQLLRFRNYVNQFDRILNSEPQLIKGDLLMKYLFANNLSDNQDLTDISKDTVLDESKGKNLSVVDSSNIPTYYSEQKHEHSWKTQLNYYIFLNLLSELKDWWKKIINLGEFQNTLQVIETKKGILNNEKSLFYRNYESRKDTLQLPDFQKEKELARLEKEMEKAYDNPTILEDPIT